MAQIKFSELAQQNIDETGIFPETDVAWVARRLLYGCSVEEMTEILYRACIMDADVDRYQGWKDYATAVVLAAEEIKNHLYVRTSQG